MNSREKGKRGERQWRDELRAHGYTARRGQQFSGSPESPDVICDELDWLHFEVKAVERLNIEDAMEQARRDAGSAAKSETRNPKPEMGSHLTPSLSPCGEGEGCQARKVPIVAHRRSFRGWLVTMDAETFFRLLRGDFTRETRERGFTEGNGDNEGRNGTDGTRKPNGQSQMANGKTGSPDSAEQP